MAGLIAGVVLIAFVGVFALGLLCGLLVAPTGASK